MGTKYTSRTISGYNATPPADDGTQTEANKGYWATIKTKLADPVKTYADDINTAMATFADYGPITKSATYTTTTADHLKTIQCTGTFTLTLGATATMGAGYIVTIKNVGTGVITVDGSGAETIDGQASIVLDPLQGVTAQVDSTGTEYIIIAQKDPQFGTPPVTSGSANTYTVTTGETAYLTNKVYVVQINVDNTGASTIDFDSLGAKNIKLADGTDPFAGALQGGQEARFTYDGTNMVLAAVGAAELPFSAMDAAAAAGLSGFTMATPNMTSFSSSASTYYNIQNLADADVHSFYLYVPDDATTLHYKFNYAYSGGSGTGVLRIKTATAFGSLTLTPTTAYTGWDAETETLDISADSGWTLFTIQGYVTVSLVTDFNLRAVALYLE